ncbi:SprT family protein [Lactobacillus sp. PV034]|uniref:SprT family protein n=1 Tax=Lactobacillus sp. PV034 TaxID=2594495 RepID=UPI00223F2319|nr:SprT family protein [Lactobacillus sp. PV034]QNQ80890.1 SprT family protein [Lactobacillus sp. PV034]
MNENDLQILVEQISLKNFHRPFSHKVKINKRMRTTGGRYFLQDHHIEVNEHFLDEKYHEDLIGIIKHELTHYHLHLAGKGYRHRDADFKNLLKQVGGSRYTPDIGLRRRPKIKYLYQCQDCHLLYPRVRRIDTRRYRCGKCHGPLNLIEKSY